MLSSKPMKVPIISVQSSYQLHVTPTGVITCDTIIKVPLAQEVIEKDKISNTLFGITPVVEILFDESFSIKIITDKGITVEPFSSVNLVPESNPYMTRRLYLVLPPKTTEIKNVAIETERGVFRADLEIEVMLPPYNYDKALFGVLSQRVRYHGQQLKSINDNVSSLNGRVDALESKTNELKLTTKTPLFATKQLPKGAGKQTINIADGVLFYDTGFSYPLSAEATTHRPKITLHGGGRDLVYTLSLNKTTNTVKIDLMTGLLTVYAGVSGEILQQFMLAIPYSGFETLSFENFDDIDDNVLRVIPKGARVI